MALAGLELKKVSSPLWGGESIIADRIHIHGHYEASILCEGDWNVFGRIISAMYGGDSPPADEQSLYVNEYMNIVCGRLVSKLNEMTGEISRVSVPEYFGETRPVCDQREEPYSQEMTYQVEQGFIRFTIQYVFPKNGGEKI
jgi:chemotaxis protein CheY-P-specific phosphatase CheC